jgi:hypothetical protein
MSALSHWCVLTSPFLTKLKCFLLAVDCEDSLTATGFQYVASMLNKGGRLGLALFTLRWCMPFSQFFLK